MWLPTTSATTAYTFRKIVEEYVDKTSDKPFWNHVGCGDFSYRGMTSLESAITSAAAFLTSFTKTSTIPSIQYLCEYYNADVTKEDIGSWSASVEHSCTTSNFAVDGNEEDFFVKMCTDICKNRPFSFVADSYDYFNFLDGIVRKHKDIVAAHGAVRIRPDSGDPTDIICGTKDNVDTSSTLEELGTLRILDDIFGHTVNSKGYKVLNGGIGIVYGDAITLDRCKAICAKMDKMGWAIENVIFGVGSYSLQYRTRDSQGWAYKATYGEINGEPIMIFKDPKTDRVAGEAMKKSQRGMVYVYTDTDGEIKFKDGYNKDNIPANNMLEPVFENGKMLREHSLTEIRNRLHNNNF
jgi:nicotinamide phosphoribosyltransferase